MKRPQGSVPTLADLQKSTAWIWVWCERCQHHAPIKFAPLIERWGANASSDKLRRCARCTVCGNRGATLQHPGWSIASSAFNLFR